VLHLDFVSLSDYTSDSASKGGDACGEDAIIGVYSTSPFKVLLVLIGLLVPIGLLGMLGLALATLGTLLSSFHGLGLLFGGFLSTLLSSFHAMLDTEVVRFVRAEVEGPIHLVASGLVCTSSFLSLLFEDLSEVDSSLEGHLSLLHGSQLSEEGGVREFGGFDGLLSSYFSLG